MAPLSETQCPLLAWCMFVMSEGAKKTKNDVGEMVKKQKETEKETVFS